MLLGGEAIFGALDMTGDWRAAVHETEQLVVRASRLGARVRQRRMGPCVLGLIDRIGEKNFEFNDARKCEVNALAAGQLFHRDRLETTIATNWGTKEWLSEAYLNEGKRLFSNLDGTFAAVFWNQKDNELSLMCDPRGDAHVYYRIDGNRLIFSSWLQFLSKFNQEFDSEAIKEFLRFLYVSPPRTIYKGISRLEPGQYLSAQHGKVVRRSVVPVTTETNGAPMGASFEDSLNKFQELFERAIFRRISGRRVGVFMSSGVDSATLAAVCQKLRPGQVEAFTIGFDDAELDEAVGAKTLAHQVGLPHTELKFGLADYRRAFDYMTIGFDQPFADPAGLALLLACEEAKGRVDVLADGSGSDGLFGAPIPRHLWFSLAVSAKLPGFLRRPITTSLRHAHFSGLSNYAALFDFDEPEELFITWAGWSKKELQELLGEAVSFAETDFYRTFRLNQRAGAQIVYEAVGLLPPEDSRLEAAASVNIPITLPYHDAELRAFVRGLPKEFRIFDGVSKMLLRLVFSRLFPEGQLPAQKHYFNIPLQRLLARADFEIVREYLDPENLKRQGLVDPNRAWSWIGRYIAGEEHLRFKVWALLVLHAWLQRRADL